MLRRAFLDHPQAVGESYGEHFAVASGFAGELMMAALACAVHAVVPCLFERTGSRAIRRLHDRMIANRRVAPRAVCAKTHPSLTGL